jgi:hypothetical protein
MQPRVQIPSSVPGLFAEVQGMRRALINQDFDPDLEVDSGLSNLNAWPRCVELRLVSY